MADLSQQETSHGDVDHGLGDGYALFMVTYKAPPSANRCLSHGQRLMGR
jgi:hypothetical protein